MEKEDQLRVEKWARSTERGEETDQLRVGEETDRAMWRRKIN